MGIWWVVVAVRVDWRPAVTNGMISLACGMYPSPWPGMPPTLPSPNLPYVLSPMYGRGPRRGAPRPGFPPLQEQDHADDEGSDEDSSARDSADKCRL